LSDSRHVLHSRLCGPFEANMRSHRRQFRCISRIFFAGALLVVRALRAMLLSSLHAGYHSVAIYPHT
jgi:hypothetical protein